MINVQLEKRKKKNIKGLDTKKKKKQELLCFSNTLHLFQANEEGGALGMLMFTQTHQT